MWLCGCTYSPTWSQFQADFHLALQKGADLVELRLDLLTPEEQEKWPQYEAWLREHADKLLICNRAAEQGGGHESSLVDRLGLLRAAASCQPRLVDFEYSYYQTSDSIRQKVEQLATRREEHWEHLLLSDHRGEDSTTALAKRFRELAECGAERFKLVWANRWPEENFQALEWQRQANAAGTIFCSGADGWPSRILGRKFGASLTYAAISAERPTATDQLTLDDLLELYRWRRINEETVVYGVIGDPVTQSLGPAVHNAALVHEGLNAVYVPIRVPAEAQSFERFIAAVQRRPWLQLRGLSVTSPHKESAWRLVGDGCSAIGRRVEALNTLMINETQISGENTDYPAAVEWLQFGLRCKTADLGNYRYDLIGCGGFTRTLLTILRLAKAEVTIYSRSGNKARALAEANNCRWGVLPVTQLTGDVVINCTSVGMGILENQSPIDPAAIPSSSQVFDAIYNPPETKLLWEARRRGCATMNGLELFLRQAARQFTLWTGHQPPLRVMREAARRCLPAVTDQTPQMTS
ncbi:MAG: Shikimate dehydrogenase (NADP(+)) [Phycisphaerae bacterium]|nr:Shikimate dehydrogenase (NADP(+)) [Phycisphaerae bacterium]